MTCDGWEARHVEHSTAVSVGVVTSSSQTHLSPLNQFTLTPLLDSFRTCTFLWVGSVVFLLHYIVISHLSRLSKAEDGAGDSDLEAMHLSLRCSLYCCRRLKLLVYMQGMPSVRQVVRPLMVWSNRHADQCNDGEDLLENQSRNQA